MDAQDTVTQRDRDVQHPGRTVIEQSGQRCCGAGQSGPETLEPLHDPSGPVDPFDLLEPTLLDRTEEVVGRRQLAVTAVDGASSHVIRLQHTRGPDKHVARQRRGLLASRRS